MELTILGSGTYQPELTRHASSYLIKIGKQKLMFDFGRGVLDQLLKLNIHYNDIDAIFISHAHADHCSELASFLHIALAEPEKGRKRRKAITIYGPKGIKKVINHISNAFGFKKFQPRHKIKVKELADNSAVRDQSWIMKSYNVKHAQNIKCLSYRLKSKNKVLAYSGDTEDCPGLRKAVEKADLAVIEASWPQGVNLKGHMAAESVGKIAHELKIKKLVLTHIAPYYLKNLDIKKEAKQFYKGPVLIAKDLMKIKI